MLSLSIATAEAQLGRSKNARQRVETVIAEQRALGVAGLPLGWSYEVAARVAIAEENPEAFLRFAALACEQYRAGKNSVLGALYERLMDEGRRAGLASGDVVAVAPRSTDNGQRSSAALTSLIAGCDDPRERAERALGLLCDGDPPTRGHLLVSKLEGLSLVASNTPCASVSEVVAFASDCLERESQANSVETNMLSSVSLGTLSAEWRDVQGTDYEVVLLAATVSDAFCIGGVALLAKQGPPRAGKLAPVAEAIARALILSGDASSIVAA